MAEYLNLNVGAASIEGSAMSPFMTCMVTALLVGVIYVVVCGVRQGGRRTYARRFPRRLGKVGRAATSGKGNNTKPKFANPKDFYGGGGPGHSGFRETYHNKPNARSSLVRPPRPAGSMSQGATAKQDAQWVQANLAARAASQPNVSAYSQLEAPVVSSLDPHSFEENPLDPFLNNITFHLTTYKNRNNNFDPRGQPALDPKFLSAQNQLVNPRNMERLAYHGPNHQIEGCADSSPPRY